MRTATSAIGMILLTAAAAPAAVSGLADIQRVVRAESAYQSGPRYCLAVFGHDYGQRTWLVLDGTTLLVDRAGAGDLRKADRVLGKRGDDHGNGYREFTIPALRRAPNKGGPPGDLVVQAYDDGHAELMFHGEPSQSTGRDRAGVLVFAARPKDAPVVHFQGPMIPDLRIGATLPGGPMGSGFMRIGSPGIGAGTFVVMGTRVGAQMAVGPSHAPMPEPEAARPSAPSEALQAWTLGSAVVVLALAGQGVWWWRRRAVGRSKPVPTPIPDLMSSPLHQAGNPLRGAV